MSWISIKRIIPLVPAVRCIVAPSLRRKRHFSGQSSLENAARTQEKARARLDISVGTHGENRQETLALAEEARLIARASRRGWVLDRDAPAQTIPSPSVVVPTSVLNDQVVSLGEPARLVFLRHPR